MVDEIKNILQQTAPGGDDAVLKKLKRALRADGDFPVRAKLVTELKILAGKPTTSINTISDIILKEPALGSRVLHLVNSAFYQRNRPITTISHAVVHMGMMALCDLCAGLVLLQKFRPAAKKGGYFAENLKKSILVSLITSTLADEGKNPELAEHGYLAGSFYCLGPLLLAYYFPQVYEIASRRSLMRQQSIDQSIHEILGISPQELGTAILEALKIPDLYIDIFVDCYKPLSETKKLGANSSLSHIVQVASIIANAIIENKDTKQLVTCVEQLSEVSDYSPEKLQELLANIPKEFDKHCQMIDLSFLQLPDYFTSYIHSLNEQDQTIASSGILPIVRSSSPLDEIRAFVEGKEPFSNLIGQVLETIVYSYDFDRAILLTYDRRTHIFQGKMAIGQWFGYDTKSIKFGPDNKVAFNICRQALKTKTLFSSGRLLFENSLCSALIPITADSAGDALIYCDRFNKSMGEAQSLSTESIESLKTIMSLLQSPSN
ncbi:MAG: HDOD domain-containing protein [Deltaproteobacteria bacterium]|nr:HDOD domain-containing protein [Deltaproteobacteria bacterium]